MRYEDHPQLGEASELEIDQSDLTGDTLHFDGTVGLSEISLPTTCKLFLMIPMLIIFVFTYPVFKISRKILSIKKYVRYTFHKVERKYMVNHNTT